MIDSTLMCSFLKGVAEHLNRDLEPEELDACVAEVLGTGKPRDLREIEAAVVRLVQSWAGVPNDE